MAVVTPGARKRRHIAVCYMATREHPTLGMLIKVGSSVDPTERIRSLGAISVGRTFPYHYESDLKKHLRGFGAWTRLPHSEWQHWHQPVFSAPSEWFLLNDRSMRIINAYLELEDAKAHL